MKKWRLILISLVLIWSGMLHSSWSAMAEGSLNDIENHWAKDTILQLVDRGIINGYADGTFRPDNSINRDEYIKLVVAALGYELMNGPDYWAQPFIDKALELGLIRNGEFAAYDTPIHREEMASIIVKAAALTEGALVYELDHTIPQHISDYEDISADYRETVVDSYRYGLIMGKKEGVFAPKDKSTRAEAATVIDRLLNPEKRNPYKDYVENHPAIQSGKLSEIKSAAITPAFFEKYKDRKDVAAYGSAEVLAERVMKARDLASKVKVTIDETKRQYIITIPEHSEDLALTLTSMTMQTEKPGTYVIPFDEANEKNGYIYDLDICDLGGYKGSWILYWEYGYTYEGKYLRDEADIAKPILNRKAD